MKKHAAHTRTEQRLADAIQDFSPAQMTDCEATEGARNLAGFFSLLIKIEQENQAKR